MGKMVYVRNKKTKAGQPGWWPERKKIEVVTAVMSTGSIPIAAGMTGVPIETIRTWRKMPWYKEMEQTIKDEDNQELDSKFSKIIKKTLDVVEDRLENGNFQFDQKTGKIIRIPVGLRDTHRVMTDLVDKRKVIRNEPITTSAGEGVNDRLVKLASQFAEFALGQKSTEMKIVGPVYENDYEEEESLQGDDEHALHEEREEGLQAGECEVQLETGTEEEPRTAQQST